MLSIFWPSDSKVCNVTSSKNIAKQTVFFERLVICKDITERHFIWIIQDILCCDIAKEKVGNCLRLECGYGDFRKM